MPAASLTLPQLRAATKADIAADISAQMSKRELIILATGTDKMAEAPAIKFRKSDGQRESEISAEYDIETGAKIKTRIVAYTYYGEKENAPVDEITITELDGADKETSWLLIKHFDDNRQPVSFTDWAEYQKWQRGE